MNLSRYLDDDCAFNVISKRNIIQQSSSLSDFVEKSMVKAYLQYLIKEPLYKHYSITADCYIFKQSYQIGVIVLTEIIWNQSNLWMPADSCHSTCHGMDRRSLVRFCLRRAKGSKTLYVYGKNLEEISFSAIYCGVCRNTLHYVHVRAY